MKYLGWEIILILDDGYSKIKRTISSEVTREEAIVEVVRTFETQNPQKRVCFVTTKPLIREKSSITN